MSNRVRLGDVALLIRRPAKSGSGASPVELREGDLELAITASGFILERARPGNATPGAQIVIRPIRPHIVRSSWILLWSRTDEFAALVQRYTQGTSIPSLSVAALAEFEIEVPDVLVQADAERLLARFDDAVEAHRELLESLERFRLLELQHLYAGVAK